MGRHAERQSGQPEPDRLRRPADCAGAAIQPGLQLYLGDGHVRRRAAPVPLETGARTDPYDPRFQGRAPWWSPDGKWVVFESNRPPQPLAEVGAGLYAIFLYEYGGSNPAIQITEIVYNCNHAKWFPNGFPGRPPGPIPADCRRLPPNGSNRSAALRARIARSVRASHRVLIAAYGRGPAERRAFRLYGIAADIQDQL